MSINVKNMIDYISIALFFGKFLIKRYLVKCGMKWKEY